MQRDGGTTTTARPTTKRRDAARPTKRQHDATAWGDDNGDGTLSSLSSLSAIHGGGGQSGFWRRALKTFHKSADTTIKKNWNTAKGKWRALEERRFAKIGMCQVRQSRWVYFKWKTIELVLFNSRQHLTCIFIWQTTLSVTLIRAKSSKSVYLSGHFLWRVYLQAMINNMSIFLRGKRHDWRNKGFRAVWYIKWYRNKVSTFYLFSH